MERFEFDPKKSLLNKATHGIELMWAQGLWEETHVIISGKIISGESRFLILAKVRERCFAAVFTKRGEVIRLISCHRADRRLERIYESFVQGQENE